ncbi:MAG: phosphoribosylanthranilate isomerase [Cellvibrionaceae bacterium]|nr:phosphoribosylanthranilate isomerase [Cellvibrionaceae bacterium]
MATTIKICGFTQPEQARAASLMGIDALGLVFYPPSPRAVSIAQAEAIAKVCAPFCSLVGLFVNAPAEQVEATLARVPLDVLQFHGDEDDAYCRRFGRRYFKALRVREGMDVEAEIERYPGASAILLDAYQPGVPGGTGNRFDWQLVPKVSTVPLILAGGLGVGNVAEAIAATGVYGVDVSGGVEQAKGDKSLMQIEAFIQAVRGV